MPPREAHIRLPPHIAEVVDRLAAKSHYSQQEVIRQALLVLDAILQDEILQTAYATDPYIRSIRKSFGKETN